MVNRTRAAAPAGPDLPQVDEEPAPLTGQAEPEAPQAEAPQAEAPQAEAAHDMPAPADDIPEAETASGDIAETVVSEEDPNV